MTRLRINELRAIAEAHKGKARSAGFILECLDEIERLTELYCIALDAAYKGFRARGYNLKKLKDLATCQSTRS